MSSRENQPENRTNSLQVPGLVQNEEPVEQLPFTANPSTPFLGLAQNEELGERLAFAGNPPTPFPGPGQYAEMVEQVPFPGNPPTPPPAFSPFYQPGWPASQHSGPARSPGLDSSSRARGPISQTGLNGGGALPSRVLVRASTHALLRDSQAGLTQELLDASRPNPSTTASRPPMVIRGTQQRTKGPLRPPRGEKRHVVNITALALLVLFALGALFAVSPLGRDVAKTFNSPPTNLIQGSPQANLSFAPQATATAIVHQRNDGIDPSANGGGPVLSTSSGSLYWPYGYCTYWANYRYHQLSGAWVAWHGNADQWVAGARLAGWHVSTLPHVPSIIVLMDGVQGASYVGHVAVVEGASGNVAHTTNMNWYANGGGFGIVSKYDFVTGPGVYFIWK